MLIHYATARTWMASLPEYSELVFCRLTQLGFLRLLTTEAVMGNRVVSQAQAWDLYDDWLENGRAIYVEEPTSLEPTFRAVSQSDRFAPKDWADSYISAFAQVAGLQLVTFDRALHRKTAGSLLLQS